MKRVYLVQIDNKISQLAYETLEQAQMFVQSRVNPELLKGQKPFYNVKEPRKGKDGIFTHYVISEVAIEKEVFYED